MSAPALEAGVRSRCGQGWLPLRPLSLCPHLVIPLHVCILISSLSKDPRHLGPGPGVWPDSIVITSVTTLSPNAAAC